MHNRLPFVIRTSWTGSGGRAPAAKGNAPGRGSDPSRGHRHRLTGIYTSFTGEIPGFSGEGVRSKPDLERMNRSAPGVR
jgi:hypothetical protein